MAAQDAESVAAWDRFPIPRYAMLDVWMALGGEPAAFERMCDEPRRTPADTWAQLIAMIRNPLSVLADTNPPPGPEFSALIDGQES